MGEKKNKTNRKLLYLCQTTISIVLTFGSTAHLPAARLLDSLLKVK